MSDTTATHDADDSGPASGDQEISSDRKQVVEYKIATRSIWQVIFAVLLTLVGIIVIQRARDLVAMLIISIFFALAIIPLVERIQDFGHLLLEQAPAGRINGTRQAVVLNEIS